MSEELKSILRREKNKSESFEDYIKRLRNPSIDNSIEEKQSIENDFVEVEKGIKVERKLVKQYLEAPEPEDDEEYFNEEKLEEEIIDYGKSRLCEEHNLPARYCGMEKKWLCEKCREIPLPSRFKILGTDAVIKIIEKPKIERVIPYDPLAAVHKEY